MKKGVKSVVAFVALIASLYIYFFVLLYFSCKNILCFKEGVAVFIADSSWLMGIIREPAGVSEVCALWIIQWFTGPTSSVAVGAILFTLIAVLSALIGWRMGCGVWLTPLLVVPASALALVSCNTDYNLSGTVAFAFMLAGILPLTFIGSAHVRALAAAVNCLLLAWVGGSIMMLYALVVLNCEMLRDLRRSWIFALLPAFAFFLGEWGVNLGYFRSLSSALLPYSFYTHWSSPGAGALMPWILTVAVIEAAAMLMLLRSKRGALYQVAAAVCVLAAVVSYGLRIHFDPERDAFARLSYLSSVGRWDQIVNEYPGMPHDNLILQNIVNLALAEKNMLGDVLFHNQCLGVASLHNPEERNPYAYMTLSDVYYSMGLIALAQKYAFEANEAFGNFSPRMLKRLVDTNIITGQTEVARKYIGLLSHTGHYSSWASERRLMAEGIAALDPALESKRRCLFPDNRFAGYVGIDDDMLQALRSNNTHTSTMQYLCAYYMLGRNVPRLISVIEEFHGTPALRVPLPEHLQEAVVIDAIVNGSGIDAKYQIHPSVMDRCKAFWALHQPQPYTLWHYLRGAS